MERKKFAKFETQIDSLDLKNEQLMIRGKNLCEMIDNHDFIDIIFYTLINKNPSSKEKRILNASLVSFHAGFEAYVPSVLFPRIAISTGSSVPQALASGFCASGPLHLGAIEETMKTYLSLEDRTSDQEDVYQKTRKIVGARIGHHERLFGFGHPIFKKDPRPQKLRDLTIDLDYSSTYLSMYDAIQDELFAQKNIYPNIDGINGAILLSLGFRTEHGVGLFLLSRTIGMLAHISEELEKPPWYAWSSIVGGPMAEYKLNGYSGDNGEV